MASFMGNVGAPSTILGVLVGFQPHSTRQHQLSEIKLIFYLPAAYRTGVPYR